jgi:hypothetical protein
MSVGAPLKVVEVNTLNPWLLNWFSINLSSFVLSSTIRIDLTRHGKPQNIYL